MALDRSLLLYRCGEDGIGRVADDPLLLYLGIKFAMDSMLEGAGFEPSVPALTRIFRNAGTDPTRRRGAETFARNR